MSSKNIISGILCLFSVFFFIAASEIQDEQIIMAGSCYHCGSVSACESGGQSYGWTGCDYEPDNSPPNNCLVHGSSKCLEEQE